MKYVKRKNINNNIYIFIITCLITILLLLIVLPKISFGKNIEKYIQENKYNINKINVQDAVYIKETEDEKVKQLITSIRNKYKLTSSNFGFFYYNINQKKYYFYNENKYFTAASTVKVPISMYYYDKINSGEISLEDTLKYTSGDFEIGGGAITNEYEVGSYITFSKLLEEVIINSDNTANNILIGNIEGSYRDKIAKYSNRELSNIFYSSNVTCPGYSYDVIKYLYKNSEMYEKLINDMKKSSYGIYLKKYIDYDVAHKYGSYNDCVHDYGIIYGKETYLVGVFTKNINNPAELIANIGKQLIETIEKD